MADRSQRRDSAAAMVLLLEALASSTSLIRQRQEYYGLGVPPPPPPPPHGNSFVFEQYGPATPSTFIGFFPWIKRLIWYLFVGTILLCSSLCLYGVFYNAVMPGLHASEKLYFDYEGMAQRPRISIVNATTTTKSNDDGKNILQNDTETCDNNTTINVTINETDVQSQTTPTRLYSVDDSNNHDLPSIQQQKQQQRQQRQLSLLKQRRSAQATADLFSRQDQWIAHHPDIIPHPKAQTRILPRNVAHYIEVVLDLPESEHNRKVGIFGVLVELQSNNGTLLASSLRTARMPHESKWIAVVRKAVCIVPLLLGALQESRRVLVPSFRYFVESERLPLRYVTVSIIMSPEQTQQSGGEGDCLEVLYGYLHIGKELTEFQLLLKEWFFTCMVFGTMFFYGIQVMLLLGLQAYGAMQRERQDRNEIHSWEDDASDILPFDDTADSTSLHGGVERGSRPDNRPMEENLDGNHSHHNTEEEFYDDDRNDAVFFECDGSFPDGQEGEWEDLPTETTGSFGHAPPPTTTTFGATRIPDDQE
ncbi:Seipin-like protein [Nitzschia inconspicua]|uniref:Seipin-like protein n=1 Tax=Nitzschia inconspicua TaxID=303405 RepID=A0A9K3L716_9STRA|nr:Seipin-like protein [Nitzschia inconspicua]